MFSFFRDSLTAETVPPGCRRVICRVTASVTTPVPSSSLGCGWSAASGLATIARQALLRLFVRRELIRAKEKTLKSV